MALKIGVLTSGGDCPGLNAVIRAVVRKGVIDYGAEVIGIWRGWRGLIDNLMKPLGLDAVSGILPRGGTILRTSRTNPFAHEHGPEAIMENARAAGLDAVIAVGGDDTMTVAHKMFDQHGLKVVGVPKTIDNDVIGTDYTFGFDTTVNIAMDAIDRIHTTAESHDRVMVIEVMGRDSGWIALYAGLAGGADMIVIPEQPISVQDICELIRRRHERGKDYSIVVVAEGATLILDDGTELRAVHDEDTDEFGHARMGGIGNLLAIRIQAETGYETRVTVLGHTQRGGSPSSFDRILGTRFGIAATDFVHQGKFGRMVATQGDEIVAVDLADVAGRTRYVSEQYYGLARPFFG